LWGNTEFGGYSKDFGPERDGYFLLLDTKSKVLAHDPNQSTFQSQAHSDMTILKVNSFSTRYDLDELKLEVSTSTVKCISKGKKQVQDAYSMVSADNSLAPWQTPHKEALEPSPFRVLLLV
jgi:hypothetical protein